MVIGCELRERARARRRRGAAEHAGDGKRELGSGSRGAGHNYIYKTNCRAPNEHRRLIRLPPFSGVRSGSGSSGGGRGNGGGKIKAIRRNTPPWYGMAVSISAAVMYNMNRWLQLPQARANVDLPSSGAKVNTGLCASPSCLFSSARDL